ncbi:hypothetical protein GCM10009541_23890 [Micromonospora gifhornensis]|uniref:Carbohydrate binding domain-containing protein n=1 Tax=Micromonospora gifhornensis TaxID=84594 RepID=A0ABQ4IH47_9ACTN|nr:MULTISPECIES: hypothetical protein [Micromonospora]PMR61264.1 hypothetical protein C1A38_09935 [Verrucosispora sp. ts21]GIJ17230.1 hypothetical protein Vgi01_39140 [Micromonospora gifhornensis]
MKTLVTLASAALLLLTTASAPHRPPTADAPCRGQIHPNPGFERGTTGWTADPRIVVLGDTARPAHTGRAYATFAGLDVSRYDLLRTDVTVPANCNLTVRFWVRTLTTETSRGDYLNVGLAVTGIPPKTRFSLAYDGGSQWREYSMSSETATTERTATVTFLASETAGNGVTAFDVDDVTFTLS